MRTTIVKAGKSTVLAILAVLLVLAPGRASAQEAPTAPDPARNVRIRAHSEGNRQRVRVEARGTDGQQQVVCASEPPPARPPGGARRPFKGGGWGDCVADVAPGSQVLIKLGEIEEPHVFIVPDEPGSQLELWVLPATRESEKSGGAVLLALGGLAILVPVVVSLVTFDSDGGGSGKSGLPIPGGLALGAVSSGDSERRRASKGGATS